MADMYIMEEIGMSYIHLNTPCVLNADNTKAVLPSLLPRLSTV